MQSNTASTDLSCCSHLGVVVKDADKTAEFLSSLGVGPWHISEYAASKDELVAGEPFRLKIASARLWGRVFLEAIQPLDETSIWARFLKTNGEGIHHIAFSVSNWDEMVSKVQGLGGRMLVGAIHGGKRWGYLGTKPGGIIMEFMEDGLHEEAFKNTG